MSLAAAGWVRFRLWFRRGCGRLHDTFHSFEACLDSHGIFMGWGVPKHRDGTVYRRGPGAAYLVARGQSAVVDRAALEQRFLGDGKVLRRRKAARELVCREDGLDDEITSEEVAEWMAWANRYVRRRAESGERGAMGNPVITWDRADPLAQARGESKRANQALRDYAAMGSERSLRKLHEHHIQQTSNRFSASDDQFRYFKHLVAQARLDCAHRAL